MNFTLHKETYKNCSIQIFPDSEPQSPREWENLGTMVCWHRRYTLGDRQPQESPQEFLKALARSVISKNYPENLFEKNFENILRTHFVTLPLYLYDHSGITINTGGFSCPWDSGQVGFIYAKLSEAQKEWPNLKKAGLIETLTAALEGEVKTYASYLEGDVVGWVAETQDGEDIDSCWGYYPDDSKGYGARWDYVLSEAKSSIDSFLQNPTRHETLV